MLAWAAAGFSTRAPPADKVVVIPCGVDTGIFRPATPEARAALRKQMGWEGKFVVLNVGRRHDGKKGIPVLLKGVAAMADRHPEVTVVLKGTDSLYGSEQNARMAFSTLTPEEGPKVQARLGYLGATLSTPRLLSLYQAADVYISPYHAEGFNLPVLEAAACGLPVICTSGGSTDDFTSPEFASGIRSLQQPRPDGKRLLMMDIPHFHELFERVITDEGYRARAREAGPAWVEAGFTWKHSVDRLVQVMLGD